jgi:hypothetical protein
VSRLEGQRTCWFGVLLVGALGGALMVMWAVDERVESMSERRELWKGSTDSFGYRS